MYGICCSRRTCVGEVFLCTQQQQLERQTRCWLGKKIAKNVECFEKELPFLPPFASSLIFPLFTSCNNVEFRAFVYFAKHSDTLSLLLKAHTAKEINNYAPCICALARASEEFVIWELPWPCENTLSTYVAAAAEIGFLESALMILIKMLHINRHQSARGVKLTH
jgi:hypothetical protein